MVPAPRTEAVQYYYGEEAFKGGVGQWQLGEDGEQILRSPV